MAITIKFFIIFLTLGGMSLAVSEEVAFYRFDIAEALGKDAHGRYSLNEEQLLAKWMEGGALEKSVGYADFSEEVSERSPERISINGLQHSHSVSMWVKPGFIPAETGVIRYFYSLGPSTIRLSIMRTDSGTAYFGFSLREETPSTETGYLPEYSIAQFDPRVDRWYHIVYTYNADDGIFRFFVDGDLKKEMNIFLFKSASTVVFGWASGSKGFQGGLDDIKIFDQEISLEVVSKN